jgi:hypothetical protein
MSEILNLSDYRHSEKPTIPEQPIPLVEAKKNGAERLNPNEELVQEALKNVEILKARSTRKDMFKELENKLVPPVEGYPNKNIVIGGVKISPLDRYPSKHSPAAVSAKKIILRASGIFIADQIINGTAPKIDDIFDTSRSAYIQYAAWPPVSARSYINDRDDLESSRQEVTEQISGFINDHPEVTAVDFEAAVAENAENEYAKDRCANYCHYGFGIEDAFAMRQVVNIDYLKKVTEEDNAEGTVNYRLTHD